MGNYTELHYNCEVSAETRASVISLLHAMTGTKGRKWPATWPKHELFNTERWKSMLRNDSYYFHADTYSTFRYDEIGECYYLCIRCNLKNYDNEIEKFIDWISNYIEADEGDFLGFHRYEESETPTLIYAKSKP